MGGWADHSGSAGGAAGPVVVFALGAEPDGALAIANNADVAWNGAGLTGSAGYFREDGDDVTVTAGATFLDVAFTPTVAGILEASIALEPSNAAALRLSCQLIRGAGNGSIFPQAVAATLTTRLRVQDADVGVAFTARFRVRNTSGSDDAVEGVQVVVTFTEA